MIYMPIAARGECIRMLAALGGVEMMPEKFEATAEEKAACGSPGSLPILIHGDLKLSQSLAIEAYIAGIAPK
jgi:glutathione S-transferase